MISTKVEGLRELRNNIERLDEKLKRTSYRYAARKGGDVFLKAAKEEVPVRTGAIKKALVRRARSKPASGEYEAIITVRGGVFSSQRVAHRKGGSPYKPDEAIRYYRFLELGTKYHPAKPFLEPIPEEKMAEAIEAFQTAMREAIGRYLHR